MHPVIVTATIFVLTSISSSHVSVDAQPFINVCGDDDAVASSSCPFPAHGDDHSAAYEGWPPRRSATAPLHIEHTLSYPALGYAELGREREIPLHIRVPTVGPNEPRPIVILVHGGAEGGDVGDNPLVNWSLVFLSRGFVTINLVIPPRDGGVWTGLEGEWTALCGELSICGDGGDGVADCPECEWFRCLMYDRPHDIREVLRGLAAIRADVSAELAAGDNRRFDDPEDADVVLFGHSAGSEGVQSAAGVTRDFNFDGILDVDLTSDLVEHGNYNVVGVIAASPKGPFSPAFRQNPTQPGCSMDGSLEPGCGDEDSCFVPFAHLDPGGSCIAPDSPELECPYGEPWGSPVCVSPAADGGVAGWDALCREVGNLGFHLNSWAELAAPILYLTGAEDTAGGQLPSERRWAAEHPGPAGSYLLWFEASFEGKGPLDGVVLGHDFYALGGPLPALPGDFTMRMVSTALAFVDSVAGPPRRSAAGRAYLDGARAMSRDGSGRVVFGCYSR